MPQPTNLCNKSRKKVATSNGRIPAFNNTFAFRHNPKSKKTANILASPIQYCCRRCHEKLVWRKTYRKYKPLTQPTSCNLCNKRNITAAYHTVCNTCSTSHPKAIALLQEWNSNQTAASTSKVKNSSTATTTGGDGVSATVAVHSDIDAVGTLTTKLENNLMTGEDEESQQIHQPAHKEETTTEDIADGASVSTTVTTATRHRRQNHHQLLHRRVCTVCFKQPALPDDDDTTIMTDDGMGDHDLDHRNRPLKLRQVKALQRQREKQQQQDEKKPKKKAPITDSNEEEAGEEEDGDESDDDDDDDDEDNDEQYEDDDSERCNTTYNHGTSSEMAAPDTLNHIRSLTTSGRTNGMLDMTNDDDINDPFLQAIGGAQNLLVGEAYQKKLLEKNTKPSVYE